MTRKTFVRADLFISNDGKKVELERKLYRYLDLIFDVEIHTPTKEETAMHRADGASANSGCMSRQVGAAILSQAGELIAVGWNDVPKYNGGLYTEDDQHVWDAQSSKVEDYDYRCFKWANRVCHNETRRNGILDNIAILLKDKKFVKPETEVGEIRDALNGTEIDSLTEFSRSIHAEMEAILSVAREGKNSLVGATLFTTTYPCHNCARHIVASGIQRVVYIEPYLKSLAIKLHKDAITEDPNETGKVLFRQFDGVSPRVFSDLFKMVADRKDKGKVRSVDPTQAVPIFQIPLDGPAEYEAKIIADLSQKEQ
jgi:deoxycytidylate deaminase